MLKSKKSILVLITLLTSNFCYGQNAPFEISIVPLKIEGLGGIQSYAFAQHNGKWLIIGGRLDGLHQRQPFAAFDLAGHNNQLIVVDPIANKNWTAPLSSLPNSVQEQLSSTNMEFYQEGEYLYFLGGYGYSASVSDHITFNNLTAIKVPDVINAVINNTSFTSFIRQITDNNFQVTGGRLKKINDTYYLLGGQKFMGRYNPMGPGHGPGFTQEYTNSVRKFEIVDNGTIINITHLASFIDSAQLHRRDYNAESQILPNGNEGITMFSGVFQPNANLPFLNSVTIDSQSYYANNSFKQYYNHYHCPVLPLYSEKDKEMHTVFFGGIAQFYDSAGILVQDNNVPFVNTIARVTRAANGKMSEHKLPIVMPSLLGAGAEFIPNTNFPHFKNEVFKMDSITKDSLLIGYIYGGISSTSPNIFFTNNGSQSDANNQIFKVFIKEPSLLSIDDLNTASTSSLNLTIYPNPTEGELKISFNLSKREDAKISVLDLKGKLIDEIVLTNLDLGKNLITRSINKLDTNGIYFISLETSTERITHKLILKK